MSWRTTVSSKLELTKSNYGLLFRHLSHLPFLFPCSVSLLILLLFLMVIYYYNRLHRCPFQFLYLLLWFSSATSILKIYRLYLFSYVYLYLYVNVLFLFFIFSYVSVSIVISIKNIFLFSVSVAVFMSVYICISISQLSTSFLPFRSLIILFLISQQIYPSLLLSLSDDVNSSLLRVPLPSLLSPLRLDAGLLDLFDRPWLTDRIWISTLSEILLWKRIWFSFHFSTWNYFEGHSPMSRNFLYFTSTNFTHPHPRTLTNPDTHKHTTPTYPHNTHTHARTPARTHNISFASADRGPLHLSWGDILRQVVSASHELFV